MLDPYYSDIYVQTLKSDSNESDLELKSILESFINQSSSQFNIFHKNNKIFVFSSFDKKMISFSKENMICLKQEEINYESISLTVNENKIVLFRDKNRNVLKRNHDNSLIIKNIFEYIFNLIYSESNETKISNN